MGRKGGFRSREIDFVVMPNLISEETLASQEVAMKKSTTLLMLTVLAATAAHAQDRDDRLERNQIRHVLLLSIDGMHAVDFLNCSKGMSAVNNGMPYCPNLASLGATGVNYVAANTSKPSDSFPGLMTIVTGATPRTMGVYYDVGYDRSLDAPAKTTGNGVAAGPGTPNAGPSGSGAGVEGGIDLDQSKGNWGAPGAGLTD